MDLARQTKRLCRLYSISPARTKGQNFLIKEDIYDFIVSEADIKSDDIVLEAGPGLGFLTAKLAKKAKKVIAIELDDDLAGLLQTAVDSQKNSNIKVVNKNILDIEPCDLGLKNFQYKIVANLPYNITSVFLKKFLTSTDRPKQMTLMLQKEVAQRIVAYPGRMSLLAVSVQFFARAEILKNVGKENFWPEPAVDSAIIKIVAHNQNQEINQKDFFRLVKIGFSNKRKKLKNNLASGFHISQKQAEEKLKSAKIEIDIRAQQLGLDDWKKLLGEFL